MPSGPAGIRGITPLASGRVLPGSYRVRLETAGHLPGDVIVSLHKGFCRPVLAGHPVVYHHTPNIGLFSPAEWCVIEYACPDRSRDYVGVFKLQGGDAEYRLHLRGVDDGFDYEVTLDNGAQVFRMSGRDLALQGLPVRLDAAMTSEYDVFESVGYCCKASNRQVQVTLASAPDLWRSGNEAYMI